MNTVKEQALHIDFDPLMEQSADFLQNPYPVLERYRQTAPVIWSGKGNHWIVSGMDEANFILKNNSFGKRLELWKHPNPFMRIFINLVGSQGFRNILRQDPPEHTRVRGLMSSAFVPSVVHGLEPEIQTITNKLIDSFENRKSADLISEFAFPLPITVIAELLGIPGSDRDQFKKWSTLITASLQGNVCPMKATKSFGASLELRKYLRKIIAEKLKSPGEDLLSSLAQISTADEGRLSEKELVANSILILIAGHETTVNLIGNGIYA
ncbi:MAG: cytochrome P450, partial [Leptolyngbya sp.]|nr:cytochrome P450 [Candidatus Melainabacteria bacterium]